MNFQYSLKFPPDTVLYVSAFYYFRSCLCTLHYTSNSHASTLEERNLVKAGPDRPYLKLLVRCSKWENYWFLLPTSFLRIAEEAVQT